MSVSWRAMVITWERRSPSSRSFVTISRSIDSSAVVAAAGRAMTPDSASRTRLSRCIAMTRFSRREPHSARWGLAILAPARLSMERTDGRFRALPCQIVPEATRWGAVCVRGWDCRPRRSALESGQPGESMPMYARHLSSTIGLLACPVLAPAAVAQLPATTFFKVSGSAGNALGAAARGTGDVNKDGYQDIAVGAPEENGIGAVKVFSGRDGSLIWKFNGVTSGDRFGFAVGGAS